ncbi:MAG: hypothetical protein WDW38_002450 [Sanguina aurantia]
MDADSLAAMLSSTGMVKDAAQAQAMAAQMKSLKPGTMSALIKLTVYGAKAYKAAVGAKAWAAKNVALVVGLLVLLFALLLRWRGYL